MDFLAFNNCDCDLLADALMAFGKIRTNIPMLFDAFKKLFLGITRGSGIISWYYFLSPRNAYSLSLVIAYS